MLPLVHACLLLGCALAPGSQHSHRLQLARALQAGRCNLSPSAAEQGAALVDALADVLWQARTGTSTLLAVPAPERGQDPGQMGYPQLMRSLVMVPAPSQPALQVGSGWWGGGREGGRGNGNT